MFFLMIDQGLVESYLRFSTLKIILLIGLFDDTTKASIFILFLRSQDVTPLTHKEASFEVNFGLIIETY